MPEYNAYTDNFTGSHNTPSAQGSTTAHDTAAPSRAPHYEVGKGGVEFRFDSKGGASIHRDSDTRNTFESATDFGRQGDLLSTAVNATGSPVVGRALTATDRIRYEGIEIDLVTASRMGLVTRDAYGNFTATDQGNQGAAPIQAQKVETKLADGGTAEAAEAAGFRADDATEAVLTDLVGSVSQSTNMAMVNSYAREGEVSPRLIAAAADQAGVSSEEMAAKVTTAMEGLEAAVEGRIAALGVHDDDLFASFVNGSAANRAAANEAMMSLMLHNSTAGFEQLATSFVEQLDSIAPDDVADALKAAGLPFHRVGGQTLITFGDGSQVSYGVAVKQGLIKVSRAA